MFYLISDISIFGESENKKVRALMTVWLSMR